MQNNELKQLMQDAARDAARYASEEHQLVLDHTAASLTKVDQLLSALHQRDLQQKHSDELIFTLSSILGAYIGQIFIEQTGGDWQVRETEQNGTFVFVQLQGKEFPFASICYHKIRTDNSISLQDYVNQALSNAAQ